MIMVQAGPLADLYVLSYSNAIFGGEILLVRERMHNSISFKITAISERQITLYTITRYAVLWKLLAHVQSFFIFYLYYSDKPRYWMLLGRKLTRNLVFGDGYSRH